MIRYFLIGFIILICAFAAYEHVELRCRKLVRYSLKNRVGMKAVLITDLHNKRLSERDYRRIRAEKPDCFLLAGDMLTKNQEDYTHALEVICNLSGIARVYYSLGNHELSYREKFHEQWGSFILALPGNCFILDDSHMRFNDDIEIYGLSLKKEHYRKGRIFDMSLEGPDVFRDKDEDKFNILLAHNADFYDYYDRVLKADLIVSGHLHGGFVRLPYIGGLIFSAFGVKHRDRGIYAGRHIVSSGAGEHMLPLRFLNRTEIVVIEF